MNKKNKIKIVVNGKFLTVNLKFTLIQMGCFPLPPTLYVSLHFPTYSKLNPTIIEMKQHPQMLHFL